MDDPIALVSFLARSENRIDALLALEAGPTTRSDLQAETGIPRATLSRILSDFRDRGLADRSGHEFAITPLGELLAGELRSLVASIEVVEDLQSLRPWFTPAELGLDVAALMEATVTLPTPVDPLAPVRRTAEVLETSDRVRGLCNNVIPELLRTLSDAVLDGGLALDVVVTADALEAVTADPEVRGVVGEFLTTGRVDLAVCRAPLPQLAIFADGTVLLEVTDDDGAIRGLVESERDAMQAWFETTFDAYARDADPVVPEALAR